MVSGVPVLLDEFGGGDNDAQLVYSSVTMWKTILQVKDPAQSRARNDDVSWAARQPKVITSNCENIGDWVSELLPGVKEKHKEAIAPRLAVCEYITTSLYCGSPAQCSSSLNFLPEVLNHEQADEAIKALFG